MPDMFQVQKSHEVPKPDGGFYSKGVVIEADAKTAKEFAHVLTPYAINDGAHGPEAALPYTKSQIDALVEERIDEAVAKARTAWGADTILWPGDSGSVHCLVNEDLRLLASELEAVRGEGEMPIDVLRRLIASQSVPRDLKEVRLKELSCMKLDDLRAIANGTEIDNMHDLKKAELVTAIMAIEFPSESTNQGA